LELSLAFGKKTRTSLILFVVFGFSLFSSVLARRPFGCRSLRRLGLSRRCLLWRRLLLTSLLPFDHRRLRWWRRRRRHLPLGLLGLLFHPWRRLLSPLLPLDHRSLRRLYRRWRHLSLGLLGRLFRLRRRLLSPLLPLDHRSLRRLYRR